jgi:thymidylate synthase
MNNGIDEQYIELLKDILDNGVEKDTRNGKVLSVFGRQIRHKMSEGFPLLTTKKIAFKTMVTELIWFLKGDTNIKYLVDSNCHIWDGDCYQSYIKRYNRGEYIGKIKLLENSKKNRTLTEPFTQGEFIDKIKTDDEFAKKWGELGPIYGKQWRSWGDGGYSTWTDVNDVVRHKHRTEYPQIDQIQNLINDLKTNPDSRRLMVSAWNVGELDQMVLPPCHTDFQFYTRELSLKEREKIAITIYPQLNETPHGALINSRPFSNEFGDSLNIPTRTISLMWNQRSVDTPLGLPFNIASYALLLEIIAKTVNMVPDELIGNLGDAHIYKNQIEGVKEQITREPYTLPTLKHMKTDEFYKTLGEDINLISHLDNTDFVIENYRSHLAIKMPLSN